MRVLFLLLLLAAPLAANDIAVSTPQGTAAWLLLEPPPGFGGDGLSEFAGDPGLPAPDVLGRAAASRPSLDLWRYDRDSGTYTRVTELAMPGAYLYAVFEAGGEPYVLLSQGGKGVAPTTVLRAAGLKTPGGVIPAGAVALASADFADAPAVSPDGTRVALRAFRTATTAVLRVYSTTDWKLVAESSVEAWSRPVWLDDSRLICLTSDAGIARVSQGERGAVPRINDNPAPRPGKLFRLDLDGATLAAIELLAGEFPPETYARALCHDYLGKGLVVARKLGDAIVVEQRMAEPGATAVEIARFEQFRGLVSGGLLVRCAGVSNKQVEVAVLERWSRITVPALPGQGMRLVARLPFGDGRTVHRFESSSISTSGLGGLIDLRRGLFGLIEPAANPEHLREGQPLCLHTLRVPAFTYFVRDRQRMPGCDSMRNPRNLARLSALVKRFGELDAHYPQGIPSTLLAFDMKIALQGADAKKGTYVELYHGDGRGGKGRIRTEDNLSGDWLMNSIDGGGIADSDWHYSCADIKVGQVQKQAPARAGKVYDDMITQLEARRLLLFSGVAKAPQTGGFQFLRRGVHVDLGTGVEMRTWEFLKLGRTLANGQREQVVLKFVADLPQGSRGTWEQPHGLLHARLVFAMANGRDAAQTDLSFAPDSFVELPNLTDPSKPKLLLPREFRIHEFDSKTGKHVERLHAKAMAGEIAHPTELVAGGKLQPGYYVPPLSVPVIMRARADEQFQKLQRPGTK